MGTGLEFKPDFEQAKARWLAFWDKEIIDRPCCVITAPKDPSKPMPPGPPYMAGAREEFGPIVRQIVENAAATWWGGEAMPCYSPSFGPDMFGTWLGGDLQFDKTDYGTNWVVPCITDWSRDLPLRLDPNNIWWRRMLDFCAALAEGFDGKMLVAHVDLHSNMDALSAMRSPEQLCLDMMDVPETIDRAMRDARALYQVIYDGIYQAGRMDHRGTLGWVPAYHPEKTNTIQCDFAALIGPQHFRRFVVPALAEEAAYLKHTVYHYDGPECLVHLDDVCSIPGLDCIQWTTGARNKGFMDWMDLLKRIQSKGVSLWVPCDPQSIKIFHRELQPNLLFYHCSASSPAEGEAVLQWLADHT
jgi:5-methyltetrahydrofolate--homocysteine methyltransferase